MTAMKNNETSTPSSPVSLVFRTVQSILVTLIVCFAIEVTLFNWKFWISFVGITPPAAFSFSKTRFVLLILLGLLFNIFRPASVIWDTRMDKLARGAKATLACMLIALSIGLSAFSQLSGQAAWLESGAVYNVGIEAIQDGNQYNHLADALLSGSLSLDLPVSDLLLDMDNPYDTPMRTALNREAHEPIYWDYAFYDGQYYCYFGVVPCLITFLPFKALTGVDLRTDFVVVFFGITCMLACAYLLYQLCQLYYRKLSLGAYVVGFLLLALSSGLLEQVFLPRIYPIPILSALTFALLGVSLWIKAKRRYKSSGNLSKKLLILGSISAALTLGCRPQYILVALLALPIFYSEIRNRLFFSKPGTLNTLSVILPFIIVFVPIGVYNYLRFDSFFDFGAAYNLTGADMTSYTFVPGKVFVQVLEYLFLPFQGQVEFPYFCKINDSPISDILPYLKTGEPFYAGFIFLTPSVLLLFSLISKRVREALPDTSMRLYCYLSIVLALFEIVIASYVSGTNMRYFADFAWLLLIPTVMVYWSISSTLGNGYRLFNSAFAAITLLGIGLYSWTFLATTRFGHLDVECPTLFYAIKNAAESLLP